MSSQLTPLRCLASPLTPSRNLASPLTSPKSLASHSPPQGVWLPNHPFKGSGLPTQPLKGSGVPTLPLKGSGLPTHPFKGSGLPTHPLKGFWKERIVTDVKAAILKGRKSSNFVQNSNLLASRSWPPFTATSKQYRSYHILSAVLGDWILTIFCSTIRWQRLQDFLHLWWTKHRMSIASLLWNVELMAYLFQNISGYLMAQLSHRIAAWIWVPWVPLIKDSTRVLQITH